MGNKTINIVEWEDKYSVDVPEIDEHQKLLFEKFNDIIEMKKKKADPKVLTNMISEINDYSKLFFSTEERILKRQKYPDLDIHSKEHRQFIKNAIALRREIAEDGSNLNMDTVMELRDWLLNHIETSDVLYVPFLRISKFVDDAEKKN